MVVALLYRTALQLRLDVYGWNAFLIVAMLVHC